MLKFICVLLIVVIISGVYFLIKANDYYENEHAEVEKLTAEIDAMKSRQKYIKSEYKSANDKIASALVELNAMGQQDEYNSTHLKTAQSYLMDAHKTIEYLL